jgi:CDP-glucose 4,6-dehydratase
MNKAFDNAFNDVTVLVTGHTGFKGSWLAIWLNQLGAKVVGYALEAPTDPSNFVASRLADHIIDVRGDVRDLDKLQQTIVEYQPQIIFHLAAQSNVLHSFSRPKETYQTNVIGTINVLEAIRATDSVKALVSITSDKCYANKEWLWGYRENDQLGGHEPYSASKAMAELAIASYRDSFFPAEKYTEHGVAIASTRAGNVIGGGDFADFRLVPDCMRALMAGQPIEVRNPYSVRPWELVLEPLSGYMWLAVCLLREGPKFASPWNFGPIEQKGITTGAIAEKSIELWGSGSWQHPDIEAPKVEMGLLRLSWDKAANYLDWRPAYTWEEALAETVDWFKNYQQNPLEMYEICIRHIQEYTQRARELNIRWAVKK